MSEYERKLKEGKDGEKAFVLGLETVKEQLNGASGMFPP